MLTGFGLGLSLLFTAVILFILIYFVSNTIQNKIPIPSSADPPLSLPVDPAMGPRVRLHECVPVLQSFELLGCAQNCIARIRVYLPAGGQELLAGRPKRTYDCIPHLRGQLGTTKVKFRHL